MSTAPGSRITIEFDVGADPIRGSVETSEGDIRPFWGWLELIDALSRVALDEPERSSLHPPRTQEEPTCTEG